jgi:broad specificity phosphatase PhoE
MRSPLSGLLVAVALTTPGAALAQKAVIVVRHAENAGDVLTATGRAQAERLAAALENAGVGAVYSTDSKRTIATVTPLAERRKLKINIYDTSAGPGRFDARPFVARLRKDDPDDVVLVVGHVTTIPDLLTALGCPGTFTVPPLDYDDLYIVVPRKEAPATFLRVKY